MDNSKNDFYYACKIKEDLQFIVKSTKNIDMEELSENVYLLDSMMFRLIQISENANKLSKEYKDNHGKVSWRALYGLRNRIVHDYGNVILEIVFQTLKNDIPELLSSMDEE